MEGDTLPSVKFPCATVVTHRIDCSGFTLTVRMALLQVLTPLIAGIQPTHISLNYKLIQSNWIKRFDFLEELLMAIQVV